MTAKSITVKAIGEQSIRERLLLALMAAVGPTVQAFGATLHRSPTVALAREQCPALVVFPESDAITQRANGRVTRDLTVRLVALARSASSTADQIAPETQADRLLTAAHAALMADVTLGGLALGIHEQECDWEVEGADTVAAAMPARYAITYRTWASDLSILG